MGEVEARYAKGGMSAGDYAAARSFVHTVEAAVRIAADPGNPAQAFAASLIQAVITDPAMPRGAPAPAPWVNSLPPAQFQPPAAPSPSGLALDDEGNIMPGVIDPKAGINDQHAQLSQRLRNQGVPAAQADTLAAQALWRHYTGTDALPVEAGLMPVGVADVEANATALAPKLSNEQAATILAFFNPGDPAPMSTAQMTPEAKKLAARYLVSAVTIQTGASILEPLLGISPVGKGKDTVDAVVEGADAAITGRTWQWSNEPAKLKQEMTDRLGATARNGAAYGLARLYRELKIGI